MSISCICPWCKNAAQNDSHRGLWNIVYTKQGVVEVRWAQDARSEHDCKRVWCHFIVFLLLCHSVKMTMTQVETLTSSKHHHLLAPINTEPSYLTRWKMSLSKVLKLAGGSSSTFWYTALNRSSIFGSSGRCADWWASKTSQGQFECLGDWCLTHSVVRTNRATAAERNLHSHICWMARHFALSSTVKLLAEQIQR